MIDFNKNNTQSLLLSLRGRNFFSHLQGTCEFRAVPSSQTVISLRVWRCDPYRKASPRCTGHSQAASVRRSLGGYLACSERLDPPEERRDVKDGDLQTERIPFEVQQLGFFQELATLVPFIRNHFLWEQERKGRTMLKLQLLVHY